MISPMLTVSCLSLSNDVGGIDNRGDRSSHCNRDPNNTTAE